jgi:hypothetical protein
MGTVRYVVESIHSVGDVAVVIVPQTYLDETGAPRDERPAHTHTYVLTESDGLLRIAAGQNTVRL